LRGGVDVVIVSGRKSRAVEHRAKELGIQEVYQGVKDKASLCRKLIRQKKLKREQVCSMGDDLPDLPKFKQTGLSVAVADAVPEVRKAASLTTKNLGGNGAVREVCELILKAQRSWPDIISAFQGEVN
jgi:3-deoxy-D-manno-octulosonate 8-phosphate phosphatase (KDO 8-P phosphatase)